MPFEGSAGARAERRGLTRESATSRPAQLTKEKRMQGQTLSARIQNDFTYHRPPAERNSVFVSIREKAKELALLISNEVPTGREQSTALTRLEEAVMHANAGIARQYPVEQ